MTGEGVNPDIFAKDITTQALEVIPKDLSDKDAKFVIDKVYHFCKKTSEELEEQNLSKDKKIFLTQLVSEWIFHKSIDLCRAQIDSIYKENILEAVSYQVLHTSKENLANNLPLEKNLALTEEKVQKIYMEKLCYLFNSGKIDELTYTNALNQSNIDKMSKEINLQNQNNPVKNFQKIIKTVFDILKK